MKKYLMKTKNMKNGFLQQNYKLIEKYKNINF